MQNKHKHASFIEFMSLCFKVEETHNEVTIIRNPLLQNLNDSYILKTMGKIQLHSLESDNIKLQKVLRKESINQTNNSVICLINDYCLNKSYKTKQEFEYLAEQIQQSKAQLILFDISCELDHNELQILLKEQFDLLTTIIQIQNRNFREFMKFSSYYENYEDENYIRKIEKKKREIQQLTGEMSKYYQNSILIDSKSQNDFINKQIFDKIILIPFQEGHFYQLLDPFKKELPLKCQLYLLEILMTYKYDLNKVLLILPLSFPLNELFTIISLLLDYCNLNCSESFVHIQQIYSKQFKKIQLGITFGNNEQLIKQSFEEYLIKQIFENDYYLAFQQLDKQDQQFIINALCNMNNNIIINIIENQNNNKIEQFLNELEKNHKNRLELKRMKQILQKFQIQYSYQNSLKSLTGPNSQQDIYSNTSDELAFGLSWDEQENEQGNYVLVDQQ